MTSEPDAPTPNSTPSNDGSEQRPGGPRRRRRRGRGSRRAGADTPGTSEAGGTPDAAPAGAEASPATDAGEPAREGGAPKRRRRRGGRGRGRGGENRPGEAREGAPAEADEARRSPVPIGASTEDEDDEPDHEPRAPIAYTERDPDLFDLTRTWADFELSPGVQKGLRDAGFVYPTKIQSQLIAPAIAGRDLLGQAKTGTGKTAAFGLPLLSRVKPGEAFQALVLAPTRELATQIADSLKVLGRHTGLTVLPIYGGASIRGQAERLEKGPEIIVGTPGRIMDMVERRLLRFDNFRIVVLDEVDRMLDIGFRDDIRRILRQCPAERQTMMVSATISKEIEELARKHMRDAEKIVTSSGSLTVKMVQQHYLTVEPWDKKKLLLHLLTHEEPALTLVFCRLKRTVDNLAEYLEKHGITAFAMHGDMRQSRRETVIRKLRAGHLGVVIASDLASRGLDVDGITHVINYDLPEDPEVYVHRIGRTARAGRDGIAWSMVTPDQGRLLTDIESLINLEIPALEYPDFKPSPRPEHFRDDTPGIGRTSTRPRRAPEGERPPEPVVNARFAPPPPPPAQVAAEQDKARLEAKFPGGIVPSKLPDKQLFGRARSNRR